MFRLENPYFLYGLILIPILVIFFIILMQWRRKALSRFGELNIIGQLIPNYSPGRHIVKFILLLIGLAFLIMGLANPQIGSKLVKAERKGIDIMIALDVSNSMLAEDIQPNRLEKAKQSISRLIDKLGNDRIGIIVFAGKAYTQLPITSDYAAAKLFLSTSNTNIVPTQGTAIGAAIDLAVESFNENNLSKAIIIITDGENHEGDALQSTQLAADQDIRIFTIGMGSPEGSPIPIYSSGNIIGYKKDKDDNTIVTKLNETMLQQIASTGNGIYIRANNTSAGLRKVFDEINKLEKQEFESRMFADYEDRFQYFIAVGLIFLIFELFILERKSRWADRIKLFKNRT